MRCVKLGFSAYSITHYSRESLKMCFICPHQPPQTLFLMVHQKEYHQKTMITWPQMTLYHQTLQRLCLFRLSPLSDFLDLLFRKSILPQCFYHHQGYMIYQVTTLIPHTQPLDFQQNKFLARVLWYPPLQRIWHRAAPKSAHGLVHLK